MRFQSCGDTVDKVRMDRKAGIHMIGIFIALLSGALMSVQGVFNTQVTKSTGIWMANVFVQFTALLVCLAAYLITDRSSFGKLMQIEPKYMLLGGAIGAFITYTVIKSMESAGPAKAVMMIIISQLIVAYIIEVFGWFGVEKQPFEWKKVIGAIIAIAGMIIFKAEASCLMALTSRLAAQTLVQNNAYRYFLL